jgi:hypothetical protein
MYTIIKSLYLLALIIWVGEVVFFSFVAAPSIFRTFPTADAGRAVGAMFPIYYRLGYVCGAVVLVGSLILLSGAAARVSWAVNSVLAAVMLAATLYAGTVVYPRAALLRPQIHEAATSQSMKDEFSRLHLLAVRLNGVVLLCGVAVSFITGSALRP